MFWFDFGKEGKDAMDLNVHLLDLDGTKHDVKVRKD